MATEATTVPTEAETLPEETERSPMEITDFVLQTIDGEDFYTMNGFSYPASLGAPELGLEGVSALYQADDPGAAAKVINNIADAIHYVSQMAPFTDSRAACEAFLQLLETDYKDYGYIHLRGQGFTYSLAYVYQDKTSYPIYVFNLVNGWLSWTSLPKNGNASGEDIYALCDNLADTFHGEANAEFWAMESLTFYDPNHTAASHRYPWELGDADSLWGLT